MAPVVRALAARAESEPVVAVTAQHRALLDQVLDLFEIVPDYDLDIMEHGQSLSQVTTCVLEGIGRILEASLYDALVVHGDTTTTFAAALSAFYHHVPIAHVEAGMRSGDMSRPFPEEANRLLVARLARWNFAPSSACAGNLLREGTDPTRIWRTSGNTVIDALKTAADMSYEFPPGEVRQVLESGMRVVLITAHRRESWGLPMERIFRSVRRLAEEHPDVRFLVATHLNPVVAHAASQILDGVAGITIIGAQGYLPFVKLMARADLILSDSGGIQEEGAAVGTPVVVLRDVTEYEELLRAGAIVLAGTDEDRIVDTTSRLLSDDAVRAVMASAGAGLVCPGASEEIAETLLRELPSGAPANG